MEQLFLLEHTGTAPMELGRETYAKELQERTIALTDCKKERERQRRRKQRNGFRTLNERSYGRLAGTGVWASDLLGLY